MGMDKDKHRNRDRHEAEETKHRQERERKGSKAIELEKGGEDRYREPRSQEKDE